MATTNQAFIKAFRHDTAQPSPTAPASASVAHAAGVIPGATVEYVTAGAGYQTTDGRRQTEECPGLSLVDVLPYDPLPRFQGSPASPRDTADRGRPHQRIDWPSSDKRPLSSFAPLQDVRHRGTEPVTTNSPRGVPAALQAGTTIASFRWPHVCRMLWQQCGEQLDEVVERLVRCSAEGRPLIGVLGLFPERGCTTTLLALAGPLAARGGRVAVVDGNFRSPQLAERLDAETDTAWQDVLASGAPVADAIIRALDDNLDLLPCRSQPASHNPPDWLMGLPTAAFASVLRAAYDLTLVDLGAYFHPESQPIVLDMVRTMRIDGVLAVAGPQPADPRDLAVLEEYLGQAGCQLLGILENRVAQSSAASNETQLTR